MRKRIQAIVKTGIWLGILLFLITAGLGYRSGDASWNTAGSTVQNPMGAFGAAVADLLWQNLGIMTILLWAFCLGGIFTVWRDKRLPLRGVVLIFTLIFGCWLAAGPHPETVPYLQAGTSGMRADTRYLIGGPGGFIGFYLGQWGGITNGWLRALAWLIWWIGAVYIMALPIQAARTRIPWTKILPFLKRLIPVFKRAERAVKPLTKIKIKKEKKKVSPPAAKPVPIPEQLTNRYQLPTSALLDPAKTTGNTITRDTITHLSRALETVLGQFKISGHIVGAKPGPVVTLYEFEPAIGVKTSRVTALTSEIAREMRAVAVRIAQVPGSNVIGIEMPNPKRDMVYVRELIESPKFKANTGALPLILGKDIGGEPTYADLAKMPHLLVAGTTGSGKSVAINTMILSLLYRFTPAECRLILVDPKMVELSVYNNIPHLLTPVVTEAPKAVVALKWAVREMEDRYRAMSQLGVRNIEGYNQKLLQAARTGQILSRRVQTGFDPTTGKPIIEEQPFDLTPIPYIVMIVDEMSDLMGQCRKEVEGPILRLAQMARAVGIHLILATQRPSVDVITGLIKANFPTRISFQVTNKTDSHTILDEQGAELLLGRGDMLYRPAGQRPTRLHGPFVSDAEIEKVVSFWRNQGEPDYVAAVMTDPDGAGSGAGSGGIPGALDEGGDLYDKAVAIVLRDKKVSTSYIQRQLRIGYNRAADLIDRMESEGVISKPNIAGKREILVPTDNA